MAEIQIHHRESDLDKIVKAANVAQSAFGIAANVSTLMTQAKEREKANQDLETNKETMRRQQQGVVSGQERLSKYGEGFKEVAAGTPGSQSLQVEDAAGSRQINLLPIQKREGLTEQQQLTNELARERLDTQKQTRVDQQIHLLSKSQKDSGVIEMYETLEDIDRTLPKGIDNDKQDIPGFGQTSQVPDFMISDKGVEVRQSVQKLKNSILKARSGGAVTPNEAERLISEIDRGVTGRDIDLLRAIRSTRKTLKSTIQNNEAGVSPQVVEEFKSRPGTVHSDRPLFKGVSTHQEDQQQQTAIPGEAQGSSGGPPNQAEQVLNSIAAERLRRKGGR